MRTFKQILREAVDYKDAEGFDIDKPYVIDNEGNRGNITFDANDYFEADEDSQFYEDDDVMFGNQKTEKFRMEHDDLDSDYWMQCGLWEQLPESDEAVFEAFIDGEIDQEEATKILVFSYHWELEDAERELNGGGDALGDNYINHIKGNRSQQATWKAAGLDDDSIGDGSQFDDDIYEDEDDDYDDGTQFDPNPRSPAKYDLMDDAMDIDDMEDDFYDDEEDYDIGSLDSGDGWDEYDDDDDDDEDWDD